MLPAALVLLAVVAGSVWTGFDTALQDALYDEAAQAWWWSSSEPVSRLLLYDGPRVALFLLAVTLLVSLVLGYRTVPVKPRRRELVVLLSSLLLVPACVGLLKDTTGVPCPRQLLRYGGTRAYATVAHPAPATARARPRCFPAGHASGGFALLSLYYCGRTRRGRRLGLAGGLAAGWSMGIYKMVIGDHFLSHTLASMLLAWIIVTALAALAGLVTWRQAWLGWARLRVPAEPRSR